MLNVSKNYSSLRTANAFLRCMAKKEGGGDGNVPTENYREGICVKDTSYFPIWTLTLSFALVPPPQAPTKQASSLHLQQELSLRHVALYCC